MSINNKLIVGISINIIFMVFELVMGFMSGSLSLISDALCNVADVLSLGISFLARKIAQKPADENRTFGYGRATILAALLNGCTLLSFAIYIFYRAFQQFGATEPIESLLVIAVGFLGLIVNGSAAIMFINNRSDLNIRSAFLNTFFDAMASAGALITGIVVYFTGNTYIDSIVSCCIGILILIHAYAILQETIKILLEGIPAGVNLKSVQETILAVNSVKDINNLHVWQIDQDQIHLNCNISIDCNNFDQSIQIIKDIKNKLSNNFGISDSTIEIDKC